MTTQEKAAELVDSFYQTTPNECFVNEPIGIAGRYKAWNQSKQCALIAVDELIESFNSIYDASIRNIEKYSGAKYGMKDYWEEVKQEIEKL